MRQAAMRMMIVIRLCIVLASLVGIIALVRLTSDNRQLSDQIVQLEAELGRMSIENVDRIYLVEIDTPDVPPEVAAHVERVWQFRCYLPPGYDLMHFSGGGRVARDGSYFSGGSCSGGGSPRPEALHAMLTLSLQKKDNQWQAFYSFGGSTTTSSWSLFNPDRFDESLVIQKLVSSEQGPRSFNRDTILPLIKIFDTATAEDKEVAGQKLTTYAGGVIVLCPKMRESQFNKLLQGITPIDFEPSWIATELVNE